MNECKPYPVDCQTFNHAGTTGIPKHGKSRSKRLQIRSQFMPFYNAICGLLEVGQKPTRQQ